MMAEKAEIRREAMERQGSFVGNRRTKYLIEGDQKRARFQFGAEGLVQPAVDQRTKKKYRLKVFWDPDDIRLERSRSLVRRALASPALHLDVLAGAPFAIVDSLSGASRFGVIMKNVEGASWKDLCRDAEFEGLYPPPDWPSFRTRWLWAFGLASAVAKMEALNFVHADLSDGNIVGVKEGDRAGEVALVDFDAYFNPQYPSNYLGTSGFVAPEIWTQGAIGLGSDRLAMAILIQEFLLVGNPELEAAEAFKDRYTQDQICALECRAHPLLRQKYPAIADLLDRTFKALSRDDRPSPIEWREALRSLHRPTGTRVVRLSATTGESDVAIELRPGESKDLEETPFGIRADILLRESLRVRSHPGATILMRPPDGTWQELKEFSDVEVSSSSRLFDRAGKMQAQIFVDSDTYSADVSVGLVTPESFDATANALPGFFDTWKRKLAEETNWKKVGLILAIVLSLLLLLGLTYLFVNNGQALTRNESPAVIEQSTIQRHVDTVSAELPPLASPPNALRQNEPPPQPQSKPGGTPNTYHETAAPRSNTESRWPGDANNNKPSKSEKAVLPEAPPASIQPPSVAPAETSHLQPDVARPEPSKDDGTRPADTKVYRGPPTGEFVWSGNVQKGQLIEINRDTLVNGQPLPGVPVSIDISNRRVAVVTQPNPLNHFSTVVFRSSISGHIDIGVQWIVLPVN